MAHITTRAASASRLVTAVAVATVLLAAAGCARAVDQPGGTDKAGGSVTAAPVTLTLANTRGEEAQPYLDQLAELSGGGIQLNADPRFADATPTTETEALHAVQSGAADIAFVPTRAYAFVGVKSFDALMDPMLIDNLELQQQVVGDPVTAEMLKGVASAGFAGIGVLPGPIRVPSGVGRKLLGPATYTGARIGYSPSPIAKRSLEALGARPVEAAFSGDDVSGFDGIELQPTAVASNQYDSVVTSITANVGLWPRPIAIVANGATWAGLNDTQRGWLTRAAKDSVADTVTRQNSTEDLANMCRRGKIRVLAASNDQIARLRRSFAPVDQWLRTDQATAGYLDRIQAIKSRQGSAVSGQPIDCPRLTHRPTPTSTAPPSSSAATALDGSYTLSYTAQDMVASGAPRDEVQAENWGEFRLVLDRGRFASTQYNALACTWNYGTFTTTGTTIELSIAGGGGKSPNHATNQPGEVFDYGVSKYHDTMKWSPLPNAVSPFGYATKPWHHTGRPSADFLDQRCAPPAAWTS